MVGTLSGSCALVTICGVCVICGLTGRSAVASPQCEKSAVRPTQPPGVVVRRHPPASATVRAFISAPGASPAVIRPRPSPADAHPRYPCPLPFVLSSHPRQLRGPPSVVILAVPLSPWVLYMLTAVPLRVHYPNFMLLPFAFPLLRLWQSASLVILVIRV